MSPAPSHPSPSPRPPPTPMPALAPAHTSRPHPPTLPRPAPPQQQARTPTATGSSTLQTSRSQSRPARPNPRHRPLQGPPSAAGGGAWAAQEGPCPLRIASPPRQPPATMPAAVRACRRQRLRPWSGMAVLRTMRRPWQLQLRGGRPPGAPSSRRRRRRRPKREGGFPRVCSAGWRGWRGGCSRAGRCAAAWRGRRRTSAPCAPALRATRQRARRIGRQLMMRRYGRVFWGGGWAEL